MYRFEGRMAITLRTINSAKTYHPNKNALKNSRRGKNKNALELNESQRGNPIDIRYCYKIRKSWNLEGRYACECEEAWGKKKVTIEDPGFL